MGSLEERFFIITGKLFKKKTTVPNGYGSHH